MIWTVLTVIEQLEFAALFVLCFRALSRSHRMGGGGDWRRADRVCRDLGAPVDPGLSAHTPGQP